MGTAVTTGIEKLRKFLGWKKGMSKVDKQISLIADQYIPFIKKEVIPSVTQQPSISGVTIVTDYMLKKSTKTLGAICSLCEKDFAEDALVLGRTLMELCFRLEYIARGASGDEKEMRAQSFIYDGDRQRIEKIKMIDTLKKQGKCQSWIQELESGVANADPALEIPENIEKLKKLETIAAELGDELECQYHFVYWSVSKLVHPSGIGSHTYIQEMDVESEVLRALAVAFPIHTLLVGAALRLLGLDALQSKLENLGREFIKLNP